MSLRARFKSLPKQAQFIIIIVVVMVGMWMFITPFYNFIVEELKISPWLSVVVGALIVFIGIKKWRLHPW